jgi:hypothetical protein
MATHEILETFYLRHLKDFHPTVENPTELFPSFLHHIHFFSQDDNEKSQKSMEELEEDKVVSRDLRKMRNGILALDCIRICLRNKENISSFVNREFIDQLLYFIDLPPPKAALGKGTAEEEKNDLLLNSINLSTASLRCLTNLLNMNHVAIDLFLSLNGLTWLLMKLQREGHITHLFYSIRLTYMLISQRYTRLRCSDLTILLPHP